MRDIYIGIDNGVSGSIGIIPSGGESQYFKTPTFSQQNYTKAKGNITRIDTNKLRRLLVDLADEDVLCLIERPMVNPGRFKATTSALRALEATLVLVEELEFPYIYVDSKQWQKELLPSGCQKCVLKTASKDIGIRLFPHLKEDITKQKDADGLLLAEWARRNNL